MKGKVKYYWLFKSPGSPVCQRGQGLQQWRNIQQQWPLAFSAPLRSKVTISFQIIYGISSLLFRGQGPFAHCASHKLFARSSQKCLQLFPATWLRGGGQIAATILRAEILKLIAVYPVSLPLELQFFSILQSSRIVTLDRIYQCNCCLGGERDS